MGEEGIGWTHGVFRSASKFVRSWVDQNNVRFYNVHLASLLRTVTSMLSYDAPYIRTDSLTHNTSLPGAAGSQRFPGASSLNAPGGRLLDIGGGAGAGSAMLIDVLGSYLGVFSVSPVDVRAFQVCLETRRRLIRQLDAP